MKNNRLFKVGIVGSIISALCCFTPVLVVLFSAVGLSSMLGLIDYIVLPALAVFVLLTIYAMLKKAPANKN